MHSLDLEISNWLGFSPELQGGRIPPPHPPWYNYKLEITFHSHIQSPTLKSNLQGCQKF